MHSGPNAQGDLLQVIPRRPAPVGSGDGVGTGSIRIQLAPERRRKLKRIVVATVASCLLILVAAGITRWARASSQASAASPPPLLAAAVPMTAPVASAALAAPETQVPQTGTIRLQRPAMPGKVWLDGEKVTTSSASVSCGTHEVKVGAHAKPHAIDIPCGGEIRLSR